LKKIGLHCEQLNPMRYLPCVLIALCVAASAQTPEPTLRTTTSEVLLDLVVRDKHAQIIHDLRPEEVQVFENGVPQKLRQFNFVDGHTVEPQAPTATAAAGPESGVPSKAPAEPATVNELRDISVISVVIANLDPRGRRLAVDAMRKFVSTEMGPRTYVGVFTLGMGGLRFVQPYTNDGVKISAAIERATSSAQLAQLRAVNQLSLQEGGPGTADSSAGENNSPGGSGSGDSPTTVNANNASSAGPAAAIATFMSTSTISEMQDVYSDSTRYLAPLHALVQAQAQFPGRKVVLLFSAGLPVQTDTVELLRAVISAANRANVSIYALDTRGITPESTLDNSRRRLQAAADASRRQMLARVTGGNQQVTPDMVVANEVAESSIHSDTRSNLAELADGTGGELLPDSLDLLDPLRRAVEDVRTHYELSYSPSNTAMDGGFRKIEVKVSRTGARVFARDGYYALPVLNGRQIYPFEMATLKALNTKPSAHEFDFQASTLQFRPGLDRTQLVFVFEAPSRDLTIVKEGDWAKVHVCVTALIRDEQGQVVQKLSKDIPYRVPAAKMADLQRGVVSFETPFQLPPGKYMLETASVDRQGMKASVSRSPLEVTEASGLSMSDVALARRVDAIDGLSNSADPLEARGGKVTPELSGTLPPDANGRVQLYAVAYPPTPIDARVDATVEIWRDGKLIMRSPASEVPPDQDGVTSILANLNTGKLPAGHYQAHISFQYKGERVTKSTAFTLAGGS